MSNRDQILEALGRRLRGAFVLADKKPEDATGALAVTASTVRRYLATPGIMRVEAFFDLCEVAEADPDNMLTKAMEDARRV